MRCLVLLLLVALVAAAPDRLGRKLQAAQAVQKAEAVQSTEAVNNAEGSQFLLPGVVRTGVAYGAGVATGAVASGIARAAVNPYYPYYPYYPYNPYYGPYGRKLQSSEDAATVQAAQTAEAAEGQQLFRPRPIINAAAFGAGLVTGAAATRPVYPYPYYYGPYGPYFYPGI